MTRPCLRITLHLSQIGLTLGLTFTAVYFLFMPQPAEQPVRGPDDYL
jgi:hypothetical protein